MLVESVAANGGRSCINASGVWSAANGREIAEAMAERLAQVEARPLDHPRAQLAAFPDPEVAAHLGEVLWVTGDTESALNIWRGAALRNPDHPMLRETLERLGVDLPGATPDTVPTEQ